MSELTLIRELVQRLEHDRSSDAIFELAELYLSAGLLDAALDAVKRWCSYNPESESGQVLLARVYLENELFDEARSVLQQLDHSSSCWCDGSLVEIDLEIRQGHFHLAEQKLDGYLQHFGQHETLERLRAACQQRVQSTTEGEADEVMVVTPTMADLYFRQGLVEKALALYLKLLEREPDNVLYQNRVKQIRGEQSCLKQDGALQKSEDHHQKLNLWLSNIQRRRTHV